MHSLLAELKNIMADAAQLVQEQKVSAVEAKKDRLDFVTNVDLVLDDFLTTRLEALEKGVPVLSEERSIDREQLKGTFWIIDPLDGTHNFMNDLPAAISVALFRDNRPAIGAVVVLNTRNIYLAAEDMGAWRNDAELRVPEQRASLMMLSTGALDSLVGRPDLYGKLRRRMKIRNLGCQSLHLLSVAEGSADLALSQEARLWDEAAARLVAQEAGALYLSIAAPDDREYALSCLDARMLRSMCAPPDVFNDALPLVRNLFARDSLTSQTS